MSFLRPFFRSAETFDTTPPVGKILGNETQGVTSCSDQNTWRNVLFSLQCKVKLVSEKDWSVCFLVNELWANPSTVPEIILREIDTWQAVVSFQLDTFVQFSDFFGILFCALSNPPRSFSC